MDFTELRMHFARFGFFAILLTHYVYAESGAPRFENLDIMRATSHRYGYEGDEETLECKAHGSPNPTYTWLYTNDEKSALEIQGKANLHFQKLEKSQEGSYDCVAENRYGEIKFTYKLFVKEARSAQQQQTKLGSTVKLNCGQALKAGFNNNTVIAWYKSKRKLKPSSSKFIFKKNNLVLKIKSIQERDLGIYTCNNASSGKDPGEELIAFNVAYSDKKDPNGNVHKPQWTDLSTMLKQQYQAVPTGATAKLNCLADGAKPIRYSWKKNGENFSVRRIDSNFMADNKPILKMKDLVLSDTANYTCKAENKYGSLTFYYKIQVQERPRHRPILESGVPANDSVIIGSNVTIPCYEIITGTLSDYRWLKWRVGLAPSQSMILDVIRKSHHIKKTDNFKLINPMHHKIIQKKSQMGDAVHGVGLVLTNVTDEDEGYYTCLVSNHIGSSATSMHLDVQPPNLFASSSPPVADKGLPTSTLVIILLAVFIVLFCLMAPVTVIIVKKKQRKDAMSRYDPVSQSRLTSSGSAQNPNMPLLSSRLGSTRSDGDPPMASFFTYPNEFEEVFEIPYDEVWEVDPSCLQQHETLGEGAFGVVVKATAVGMKHTDG